MFNKVHYCANSEIRITRSALEHLNIIAKYYMQTLKVYLIQSSDNNNSDALRYSTHWVIYFRRIRLSVYKSTDAVQTVGHRV